MRFIDTNIIIRYLTGDHPDHSLRALDYFDRLHSGEERATMIDGVIIEAIQVLSSKRYYSLSRNAISDGLRTIIGLHGLKVQNRDAHFAALNRYAVTSLDYVDCLNISMMQESGTSEIVSFDRDFDRVSGITRVEPQPARSKEFDQ